MSDRTKDLKLCQCHENECHADSVPPGWKCRKEVVSSKSVILPTWAACKAKADSGATLSALEQFVYDNEPVPFADEECLFRTGLFAVVKQLTSANESSSPDETTEPIPHHIRFDRLGWMCSICAGWNDAQHVHCIHPHVAKPHADTPMRPEEPTEKHLEDATSAGPSGSAHDRRLGSPPPPENGDGL